MEKTIKYLENGEYHYATVRSVGDLAQLKTDSKETLVEAINELWNGGGNADPSKAPKPEGYDQLVQDVADAVKNQQEISQQWIEWQNEEAQLTEERKQAYLQAMKEMQEAIDKAKADAAALDDKTTKLDEQITKTFSDLDTSIQNMHEQLQKEADRMNQELIDTKSDLTKVRTDLQNAQLDNGRIHDELTNINGKFEHKVWQTDLDPLKEQIDRAETSVQQTKDELLGKASREDLDTVTNAVSKLDTQLKETAKGVEISVKKDELSGDVARLLNDKTNLLLGTRNFSGEDNWKNRDAVTIEPGYYKGLKSVAVQVTDRSIYQPYHVKANTAYTFSFFGKEDKDNSKATLIIKPIDAPNINIDNAEQPVHITTEWQRFAVTFSADQDCDISIQIIQGPEASNNILHLAGFKLQYGQNNTPWEPNEADVAENIEHTESQFNVYSDQIAGIVKKQEKMGDTERQLDTRITETAEGLKQTSKDLQDANGKITEFKGQLESTARGLKTEYEKYTNDAVGQISDSTLNLIRNSSFQNKDSDFDQWQNISAKANVRQDENGLRWVELTQSGLTTNNPEGITSNYFNIKQGKVTVAVDIKSGDKASLDNDSVLSLELYNDVKKRVDFYDVSLSQLGLSKELLGDHKVHRGLYRLGIDRNDAKYMTVKAKLVKNGDLYFTNFSARLSSIDDGAYEPNPDDINQQILKQNTKIEQNSKEVAIKANSVDVTRDIKSAVDGIKVGGTNLAAGTNQEYIMGFGIPDTTWKDGFAYATLPTTGSGNEILPQDPHMFWYTLTAGQEYTQTIWFRTDATAKDLKASGITWFTSDGHDYQPATIQKIGTNSYKLFCSYKWPGKNNNDVRLFDISELRQAFDLNTGTYLKFGKLKLEEGNKSTSWSPAPQDTSAEIKSAKDAAIQVASDQINLHVNEISTQFDDKLNKRINEQKTASEKFTSDGIEQTVTKITNVKNDVDRLGDTVNRVGSRNLLHNTSDQWRTLTNDGDWLQKTTASSCWTSTSDYHGGNKFTYAAKITNNSHQQAELEIWLCDQNKTLINGQAFHAPIPKGANAYDVNVTFPITTGTWYIRSWIIFTGGHAPKGDSVQVKDERLVEGATPGSWSPNPDDINQQITNTNKKIDTQTLDSANIDQMKTQGHYFVRNLTGNPIGGWVYVDVTGNNNDRIRQDVYQDNGSKHMYRRGLNGTWSGWEQGAYISDVNNVKTEVTASVKNLGDRVTTQVNSVETRVTNKVDNLKAGGDNLIRNGDANAYNATPWENTHFQAHSFYYNGTRKMFNLNTSGKTELTSGSNWFPVVAGHQYTLYFNGFMSSNVSSYDVWLLGKKADSKTTFWDNTFQIVTGERLSSAKNCIVTKTFTVPNFWDNYIAYIRFDNNGSTDGQDSVFFFNEVSLKEGNINVGYSANPDDFVEAIKEVNTKWDVANGKIEGKVTETQVNNILNGKGYATQSWAQTMFQMKSDSITLQAVRDNITNGIQNQVNSIDQKLNNTKIGNKNLFVGTNRGDYGWMLSPGNGATSKGSLYIDGQNGVRFTNSRKTTSWWVIQFPFDINKLKPNTPYTISFDIRTPQDRNENAFIGLARGDSSGSPFVESPYKSIHTKANQFVHITQTLTTTSNFEKNQQAFYFNNAGIGQCDWVDIVNLMMVEGTQSAEWSPAPEEAGSGQNLLRGTADFSWPTGIGTNGTVNLGYEKYDATTIQLHVWGKDSGIYTKWSDAFPDGELQVGETYTFSFDIKGNGTFSAVKNESEGHNPANGIKVNEEWQRVSVSGTVKSLGKAYIIYFQGDYDVRIKNVKIERGSKATPWTPHPFDDKDKGVNLLKSTAYWNPADWNNISNNVWYDDSWVDNLGHKAYGHHTAWQGLGQTVYVTPGVYTWSAQIYLNGLDSNDSVYPYMGDGQYNGTAQVQDIRKPMLGVNDQNRWIDYSTTFYVKNAGNLCVRPELNRDHGTIHVGSQKLEHGMVATPWSPSPLDDKNATITLDSADINSMKTQGHYFVRNLANNPISGWVYVDVTGNNNDRLKQEVYQDNGYEHRSRRWTGSGWTEWTTDVNNKNVVSQINITPDQIKIASNKIVIDGNTDIHGVLRVPEVRLQGKSGMIGLDGNKGIIISSADTLFQTRVTKFGMDFLTTTNGQKEIMGGITTGFSTNNGNLNGISIVLDTQQKLGYPYGGDFFSIGNTTSIVNDDNRSWNRAMDYDASGQLHQGGFMWYEKSYLTGEGQNIYVGGVRGNGNSAYDPLMIGTTKFSASAQPDKYQPVISLGYAGGNVSKAGIGFLWDQMKPYGSWDISDVGDIWFNGIKFRFAWVHHGAMFNNQQQPAFYRVGDDGSVTSGIAFAPGSTWDVGSGAWNITQAMINLKNRGML